MKALTDHQISVIGAGAWGTTLANLLAEKKYQVKIWAFEEKTVKSINLNRENYEFLPGVKLSEYLHAYNDFEKVVLDADILISATPSQYVREVTKKYAPYLRNDKQYLLVSVSKGIEHQTFKLMTQVLREIIKPNVKIAALSGPNHAEEVARKMPTATVIASVDEDILDELVDVFRTDFFVPYALKDELGIQICGAVKNIIALAIGICDGLGLGANTKASIMTLGLTEMYRVGKPFGCLRTTLFGIAGNGDLIATCTSKHSRDRYYGQKLAEGKSFEEIKEDLANLVAEGVKATKTIYNFAQKEEIYLPLTTQIYEILYENKEIKDAVKDLIDLI